jgi:hypothetical protein
MLRPEYLNIRHLPKNVLELLENKLEKLISAAPGFLLEDSYRNMLHYIKQPYEKNLDHSFASLAELDARRGLDSSKIFKNLYTLKKDY